MAAPHLAFLEDLPAAATHLEVERLLRAEGWTSCGEGDWAIALGSPDGALAARISPFDPVGPYTARLYVEASHTGRVPVLHAHRRLDGGGDLQVMERLVPVATTQAQSFLAQLDEPTPELSELARLVGAIHERARQELPWCGPLDDNPSNIMRTSDGRIVLCDPFYADGPDLYATANRDPDRVARLIPEHQRRWMTEIPLAGSGPWPREERDAMRLQLRRADERLRADG
ncbi:hypothetical protein [Microbacterium sp. TNHR37B]|uniref:hypothetical protein n=1 Tax=Microbacterium sp. TNHR37B TaxID=1775956 RepID=UPI0007B21841|nr:hypothetical protein [Microbacterium sp. TNHR37B]KZE89881.1 hypothetical protein AVP41_02683 [Microbacterium sp. TNHR37B]